ncbi:MAG: pyridoxal 5'-phosphate synthase glutaminase subunit PdxT [Lachnospiraceae bacterium]|nr:pyridoxal 5'-phosphate synthase glutaminase subunit PdxT [Lachnospiraceae bacterium]
MNIGILAVQGAFIEHEKMLDSLGISYFEIRKKTDLCQKMDGLILPGGESTVMGKLLHELGLFEVLKHKIEEGLPVLATCAGLILLAEKLTNDEKVYFATLPVTVKRNAYGRQLGSFHIDSEVKYVGIEPLTFIRAPYIENVTEGVEVLALVNDKIAGVKYKNQIGLAFHPEVTESPRIHEYFIKICKEQMA